MHHAADHPPVSLSGTTPRPRIVHFFPPGARQHVGILDVAAGAAHFRVVGTDAPDPHLAEWVVKERIAVAGGAARRQRRTPVDAVLGEVDRLVPAGGAGLVAPGAEQLVAALRVPLVEVKPDGDRVARVGLDDVGPLLYVQDRFLPPNAILRG